MCNAPGSNAVAVADHTMALMLAVTRKVLRLDANTRSGAVGVLACWAADSIKDHYLTRPRAWV